MQIPGNQIEETSAPVILTKGDILSESIDDYPGGIIVPVDKPYRWTSADVIRKIKFAAVRHFHKKNLKVGHAGTLDPLATGVLLVCIGKATKLAEELQNHDKEYIAGITFGATTPSYDLEKDIDARYPHEHITEAGIRKALDGFIGEQEQIAPLFSAKSVDGVRAYELARKLYRKHHGQPESMSEKTEKDMATGWPNTETGASTSGGPDADGKEGPDAGWREEPDTKGTVGPDAELKVDPDPGWKEEPDTDGKEGPDSERKEGPNIFDSEAQALIRASKIRISELELLQFYPEGKDSSISEPAGSPEGTGLQASSREDEAHKGQKQNPAGRGSGRPDRNLRINVADTSRLHLPTAEIRIGCSKGTYIRAFARDLGEALGSGAHLYSLERSRSGMFKVEDCLSVEDVCSSLA